MPAAEKRVANAWRLQLLLWLGSEPSPLKQLLEVNKTTAGRDKIYRIVQYLCRCAVRAPRASERSGGWREERGGEMGV